MKNWPYKTFSDLTAAGYVFRNVSKCTGSLCKHEIYWFRTPQGKFMPVDVETMLPHWSVCPSRDEFKEKMNAKSSDKKGPRSDRRLRQSRAQGTLFGGDE